MKRAIGAVLLALVSPVGVVAQQPAGGSSVAPAVEPRADQELRRMSEFLATLPRFALRAEETFDELPEGELRRQLSNTRRVAVERPNHFAADATGDVLNRASWYDGKTVTVLDKEHNVYASLDAPATIDATLDKLQDEYGVALPLIDLFYADPYAVLTEGVTYGRYLGLHRAAGVDCHHLAFSQPTIEWQIWIDAGEKPLPRKLVITYVSEPGEPQYSATIPSWALDVEAPEGLFVFEAPEGAQKIEAAAMKKQASENETATLGQTKPAQDAPKGGR